MYSPRLCTPFVSLQFSETYYIPHGEPDFVVRIFWVLFFFLFQEMFDV